MPLESWQLEFAKEVQQQRREGWGWRYDGLESWPTDKIFTQLRELGINTDAERFRQQALTAGRIKVMEDDWDNQLSDDKKTTGYWQDFPMLAVPELWERFASDLVCPELIDRRLYLVLAAEEDDKPLRAVDGLPADLAAAMALTRYLQGFSVSERAFQYKEINEGDLYDYSAWLIDLIELRGPEHPDQVAQLADVMFDATQEYRFQTELAMALALAGRQDEAVTRARAILLRFPDDLWVKILIGDVFEELGDDAEAIRLWTEALPLADDDFDWDVAAERLEPAFERAGRTDELEALLDAHARPEPPKDPPHTVVHQPEPVWIDPDIPQPQRLTAAPKIGRNSPCPCGSGKKYKKCCMP